MFGPGRLALNLAFERRLGLPGRPSPGVLTGLPLTFGRLGPTGRRLGLRLGPTLGLGLLARLSLSLSRRLRLDRCRSEEHTSELQSH